MSATRLQTPIERAVESLQDASLQALGHLDWIKQNGIEPGHEVTDFVIGILRKALEGYDVALEERAFADGLQEAAVTASRIASQGIGEPRP